MKKYLFIAIIFILFGGCTTHRKTLKSESNLKVQNDVEHIQEFKANNTITDLGKSKVQESSTVEEVTIKKPSAAIELTANFRIDSTATLRGDTALKLVDVSDKNVSVTIYQNGKNGQLTAKIKSKSGTEDVPFSEIKIKKSTTSKISEVDTTKIKQINEVATDTFKDKTKLETSSSETEKDVSNINYLGLVGLGLVVCLIVWFYFKR